ncbi:MAG: hypothetical protein ACPG6P_09000 [Akkermansiaceae bacterium]
MQQGGQSDPVPFNTVQQEIPIALEHALIRCLAMLQQHNLASAEDCSQVAASVRKRWEAGQGADPIEFLAKMRAGGGDMFDASVEMISVKMAQTLPFAPCRVAFASRLIPPSGFYAKFPNFALMSRLMLVPILYTEDLDIIGIGSINPYFADALAATLAMDIKQTGTVTPIIHTVRLDYIGWRKACDRHFKKEGVAND